MTRLQKAAYDATDKGTFVTSYVGLSMVTAGLMSYALSGQFPTGLDYVYPRNGETNPDGRPQRLGTPFNTREPVMLKGHAEEQGGGITGMVRGARQFLWNKMILAPIVEWAQNRNFYGQQLYDPDAPWYKQALQTIDATLGDHVSPIGVSGAQRALDTGGGVRGAALAVAGFGPAPKYVGNDARENRINELYSEMAVPQEKPYQYGAKTGLGRGLVQGTLRGQGVVGGLVYKAMGMEPDATKTEAL